MEPVHQLSRAYDEVVAFFASGPSREQVANFRLSDETIQRVRDLLHKNSAGTLTEAESDELDQCVHLDRLMLMIRTRALRDQHMNKTA
ncbi:MAG: hypothetical protein H0X24_04570 [Ktedonobacterales bacterium]|nr:hypothetical protein [Ktedonobacterales bacterium]